MNTANLAKVDRAADLISENGKSSDPGVIDALVDSGLPKAVAREYLILIPIAFAHMMFRDYPRLLSKKCRITLIGEAAVRTLDLRDIETFQLACEVALSWQRKAVGGEKVLAVAGRSAEFNAINGILNQGSRLEDVRCVPVHLLGLEFVPKLLKPWWKFW